MGTHPIVFFRSSSTCDWICPRKRFYNYELNGRGIVAPETPYELYLGQLVHDAIAAMVHNVPIEEIVLAGITQLRAKMLEGHELDSDAQYLAEEQCALAEGLIRGFHKIRWPQICAEYPEVVMCEKELIYDYEINGQQLRFLSKPDLVRRDKEGLLWCFEWKTTSSNKEEWVKQWETAVQVHAQIKTIEAALGEPVAGCIVQGMYKSYISQWNRCESIFCYFYGHPGNPPFEKPRVSYEYKAGLRKTPVWQKDGGVKQWVEDMPAALLASQFPQTPPIFLREHLVDAFFRQQGHREIQIREARASLLDGACTETPKGIMDIVFPQHWESCNAWNRPCEFKRLCFGAPCNPLEIGYQLRVSHHSSERDERSASSRNADPSKYQREQEQFDAVQVPEAS